jgi:hypothetical protein
MLFYEVILNILSFVDIYNINVRLTCKRFNQMCDIVSHDEIVELFGYYFNNEMYYKLRLIIDKIDSDSLNTRFYNCLWCTYDERCVLINSKNFIINHELIDYLLDKRYYDTISYILRYKCNDGNVDLFFYFLLKFRKHKSNVVIYLNTTRYRYYILIFMQCNHDKIKMGHIIEFMKNKDDFTMSVFNKYEDCRMIISMIMNDY